MIATILLIILIFALVGGAGPWASNWGGYGYGYGHVGIGVPGILLIVLIVLLIAGRL